MLILSKLHSLLSKPVPVCWNHAAAASTLDQLKTRGFIDGLFPSTSENDIGLLSSVKPQTAYAGFDPTADSLHVGNLLVLMALIHWQRSGHRSIALLGGITAMFGDPSGRREARTIMPRELTEANLASIKRGLHRVLAHHQEYFWPSTRPLTDFVILNNSSWYQASNAMDLHGELLSSFRKGTLFNRTSIRLRKERGDLKLNEFFYQCLQAYDWRYLLERYNCRFQVRQRDREHACVMLLEKFGGRDQLGNFHTGYHYTKRFHPDHPVQALLLQLLKTSSGEKYGKSANNAIWLEPHRTSPFLFYQFFLSQDSELEAQLKMFTFLPSQEIEELLQEHQLHPEKKLAQHRLAQQITLLVHGERGVRAAQKCLETLQSSESLSRATPPQMAILQEQLPRCSLPLGSAPSLVEIALQAECCSDQVEAEQGIKGGRFRINLRPERDPSRPFDPTSHLLPGNHTLVSLGEEKHVLILWS